MYAATVLALATPFITTASAQTDWKEFTNADGSFRVLFPATSQLTTGAERNLHVISATSQAQSYMLAYMDDSAMWQSTASGIRL
jgi:hypothetical protein